MAGCGVYSQSLYFNATRYRHDKAMTATVFPRLIYFDDVTYGKGYADHKNEYHGADYFALKANSKFNIYYSINIHNRTDEPCKLWTFLGKIGADGCVTNIDENIGGGKLHYGIPINGKGLAEEFLVMAGINVFPHHTDHSTVYETGDEEEYIGLFIKAERNGVIKILNAPILAGLGSTQHNDGLERAPAAHIWAYEIERINPGTGCDIYPKKSDTCKANICTKCKKYKS